MKSIPIADVLGMKFKYAWATGSCLLSACLLLAGCEQGPFDFPNVQSMIESNPVSLDGEQVMLTEGQVQCGVQADLWDVVSMGPSRAVGRLLPAGRNLHFGDDIVIGEPGTHLPYVQIRGTLQMRLIELGMVHDESEKAKSVEVRLGVEIPHPCFQNPLPQLMAVRRGRFTEDALPMIRFRMENNWTYDRLLH